MSHGLRIGEMERDHNYTNNGCYAHDKYGEVKIISHHDNVRMKKQTPHSQSKSSGNLSILQRFSRGKKWFYIDIILELILPEPLRKLIADYEISEPWDIMSNRTTDKHISNYDYDGKFKKCYNCNLQHYNLWMIISQNDDKYTEFMFQLLCVSCLAIDKKEYANKSHVCCSDGNEPIWIDKNGKPLVNWNEKPEFKWGKRKTIDNLDLDETQFLDNMDSPDALSDQEVDVLIPTNNIAKLMFHNVNPRCLLMHISSFDTRMPMIKHGNLMNLFMDAGL